ncbi:MAG: hypothetical protein EPN97_06955 [Alphaproteobacteria bacterium]|nr:MAG: hypothetical protein EPN97_06955 [Alphaproteobacteria bacterium]
MPINPLTLKQMKDGTLGTLRLQGQPLDERDWKMIGNFLRVTTSLKELDLSFAHGSLEQLADALKQNKSVNKLSVSQIVQDHNMPLLIDILKANPAITQVNLNNCYMQNLGMGMFARFLKSHKSITHLSFEGINFEEMNPPFDRGMGGGSGQPKLATLIKALEANPNIIEFLPETKETEAICLANRTAAEALLTNAVADASVLSKTDLESIKERLPAFLHLAEFNLRKKDDIAQLLVNIEDTASTAGVKFDIPARYAAAAASMPRPFKPAAEKVDFTNLQPIDLAKPEPAPRLYQAVEAGQVDELLAYLKKEGMKLTVDACFVKPEGKRENLIELIARQGKLAEVMTVDNWLGDPRGLKKVTEAVPAREWQRQLKDLPADRLIFQVNAASFKEARRPKVQPAGPR